MHGSPVAGGRLKQKPAGADLKVDEIVASPDEGLKVAERETKLVRCISASLVALVAACLQMSIAANQAAEIPATIIRVLKRPLGESPRSHESVEPCEMRPACSALLRAGHVLPTPLREKTVIPAGHERGAILQRYSECGLDGAPVREHPGFCESPIVTDAPRAVELVPDLQLVQRPRASISHQDSCVSSYTV